MDLGLSGSVALITGAAGDIGSAIAETLAEEGCHVALVDISCGPDMSAASARVAAHAREVLHLAADVRVMSRAQEVVEQVVAHFGRLDILVCAAGIARDAVSWKLQERDWNDVIDVNLKGCFNYARAVVPVFREQGGGRIVNIASINGMRGKIGQANYAAAKAGIIGLSKTLAREVGRFDVTVNVIAPGMVDTKMTRNLGEKFVAAATVESVLGRISAPRDVASAVAFLCSEQARQITGEVLRVDAGQYI